MAQVVTTEAAPPEDYDYNHVAAGLAVLAAIAASDALCCRLLGERSRGQDHREAISLLSTIRFGAGDEMMRARRARTLAGSLGVALDLKDVSHYGMTLLQTPQVKSLMRAAKKLVDTARSVIK